VEALRTSSDVLFILLGAILVLAMHAGFAFLELGTVRKKNQVNVILPTFGGHPKEGILALKGVFHGTQGIQEIQP
jgi:ammonia channel protein AmtB